MEIAFRPLRLADLPAASALWHQGWHDAHASVVPEALTALRTLANFHERLARDISRSRAAVAGEALLGFSILKENEVYQFYVAPGARGTGAAGALMADAEAQLRAAGHKSAWLACTVGNVRAGRFYEKSGWHRAATETMSFETSGAPFPLKVWRYEKALA